jgi:pimeloyl-ACP methyl ester carboxylesterase
MRIKTNGIELKVETGGTGSPSLVFLHYWGGSSRTWRHVTALLDDRFRTVAIDQRGWGRSDAPPDGYTLADLADDAAGVIDALKLDRYILVGHSMGGKAAQLLASRQPTGLAGLVLIAPSPPSPMALPLEVRQAMVEAYTSRESVISTVSHVLSANPLSPDDLEGVIADSLRGSPAAKTAWPLAASQEDITEAVSNVAVPTMIISGERDRVAPPRMLEKELLPRIMRATMQILPGLGHLLPLEAPQRLAELIKTFAENHAA